MAKFRKVPSQAASGSETFSDNLVGFQITDGVSQQTTTSFTIDRTIPEKDAKTFHTLPFSDFLTLNDLNQEKDAPTTESSYSNSSTQTKVKFYDSKEDTGKSLFGSLKSRIGVSVENIIKTFPASMYVDTTSPSSVTSVSAEDITYDKILNQTTFKVQVGLLFNPFDILIVQPKSNTQPESDNSIRNFYSSYTKYLIDLSGVTYDIVAYVEPDDDNKISLTVNGNSFPGITGYTENYHIRPNNGITEEFFGALDELETNLLDRDSSPKYQAKFKVPRDLYGGSKTELVSEVVIWPQSRDGWNIQIIGIEFDSYVNKLSDIATEVDDYKSNLVVRFLTAPQLFEFDTDEKKMESALQIYGQSFDKIKKFIDNIAYMRNVSYDKINNVPDVLLKNLSETLGFGTFDLFDEKSFQDSLYNRHDTQYDGVSTGTNLVEAEYEFYRRMLVNLAHIYKSKGTRLALDFFLKFIGAPEPMIRIDEYVYNVSGALPASLFENDILSVIQGTKKYYTAVYGDTGYTVTETTGTTLLSRSEYPVDESTGLPRKASSTDGTAYFGMGAGWYRKTLDHRSVDIFDAENSNLSGNTKVIKTKSKPFTYGEDYFDLYRNLPGLDYGFDLTSEINNNKTEIVIDESESKRILNRKNISVFLSSDRAIDYDVYTKSRNLSLTFGTLTPQTGVTFAEFLQDALSNVICNSHVIKYQKEYRALKDVYESYKTEYSGFTPYNYIKVNEFIERMSPYWTNIIDQFVPATTLWTGGNLIENGIFGRSKFRYMGGPGEICAGPLAFPAQPLYPDFEASIEEDLETILGGGTVDGVDVAKDQLRGLFEISGLTYTLFLDINHSIYSATTEPILFSGFTPASDCTSLTDSGSTIPLICDYTNWIDLASQLSDIKSKWKATLDELVATVNATLQANVLTHEYIGETVQFTIIDYECDSKASIDFYFEPKYIVPQTECNLRVEVYTSGTTYSSPIDEHILYETVYIKVINDNFDSNGGFVAGVEENYTWSVNIFVASSTNCETDNICTLCDYLTLTGTSECVYEIPYVNEASIFDIIVTDGANCEQKIRIEGVQVKIDDLGGGLSGYTLVPKIQYRTSFDFGLKHGTVLYKVLDSSVVLSTWENLEDALANNKVIEVTLEDVAVDDILLSIAPKDISKLSHQYFKNAPISGYDFTFDYIFINVINKECFSSIKKYTINNEFEILPTTKLFVYTNINEHLEKVPYYFTYKYPEDLVKKVKIPADSCNKASEYGDSLVDQYGFLIEVSGVTLDYCNMNVFYQLNCTGNTPDSSVILLNGKYGETKRVIMSYENQNFECMDIKLQQYYDQGDCKTDPLLRDMCENLFIGGEIIYIDGL